jgi:hypothetical protein
VATAICRSNRDANPRVSNLQRLRAEKAYPRGIRALLNDNVRSSDDNSRHATFVGVTTQSLSEQVTYRLFHDIAPHLGNGAGERDVFGTYLHTVLGVATLLNAAVPH